MCFSRLTLDLDEQDKSSWDDKPSLSVGEDVNALELEEGDGILFQDLDLCRDLDEV